MTYVQLNENNVVETITAIEPPNDENHLWVKVGQEVSVGWRLTDDGWQEPIRVISAEDVCEELQRRLAAVAETDNMFLQMLKIYLTDDISNAARTLYLKSEQLNNMEAIPSDYTDDKYWIDET